jgi:hypothetical protein
MSLADPVIAIRALRMSRLLGIATGRELVRCGEQVGEHFGSSFRECCSEEDKNEFLVKTMKGILSLGAEIEGIEYCTIDLLESEPVENVVNNIIEIVKLAFDYFMGERRGRFSVEDLVRKAVPTD